MHKPLLFYYHFLSVVDVDALLCRTFFSHFLTIQVVPALGINGFCLELDERNARHALVVVVREGYVLHASPDIFLQTRIVDEGVAVVLQRLDALVAVYFLLAYWVFLRSFHQHIHLPVLVGFVGIV